MELAEGVGGAEEGVTSSSIGLRDGNSDDSHRGLARSSGATSLGSSAGSKVGFVRGQAARHSLGIGQAFDRCRSAGAEEVGERRYDWSHKIEGRSK